MIDIESIINSNEMVNLEAKEANKGLPNSIWETYSSFANTFGGTIVLGIKEDKVNKVLIPKGVSNANQMISDIWNILNNKQKISSNILLEHHVYKTEYQGMDFVVIEVPRADRRDKPVYIGQDMFKGTYRRNFEGDYCCKIEEVKQMLRDQGDSSQDALTIQNLSVSDLNMDSIHRYRNLFNTLKPNHTWSMLNDEEFLLKIGAVRKDQGDYKTHPTLGGLIFFGNYVTITDELSNYFLDYREISTDSDRWKDRVCSSDGSWSGNIFDFYFKIIDKLTADIKKPFKLDSKMQRIEDTSIHRCIRECLANALIHADYYGKRGIVIEKTDNKITFSNPGTFRIDIEEAIAGGISDARNGRIFNMFSLINIGERSGMGLCDVYRTWELNGFNKPTIKEDINPERITITLCADFDGNDGNLDGNTSIFDGNLDGNTSVFDGNLDGNDGKNFNLDGNLTKNEQLVLKVISTDSKLTAENIALQIKLSKPTVERALRSLKEKGIIIRKGSTRGYWVVVNK